MLMLVLTEGCDLRSSRMALFTVMRDPSGFSEDRDGRH